MNDCVDERPYNVENQAFSNQRLKFSVVQTFKTL